MKKTRHISKAEEKLLKRIREDYSKEQCIQIWDDVKKGMRKQFPRGFWEKYNHRKYVIESFVDNFKKQNKTKINRVPVLEERISNGEEYEIIINRLKEEQILYPQKGDFQKNKLYGLLVQYYSSSPLQAFNAAGFSDKNSENYDPLLTETPWLALEHVPLNYWKSSVHVKKAVNWLAKKLNKEPTNLEFDDFGKNNLWGLMQTYDASPVRIIRKAGYEVKEIERGRVPNKYWRKKENRVDLVKDLIKKINKPITEIGYKDFTENGLGPLIKLYGNEAISKALNEAGYKIELGDTKVVPRSYWRKKENRVRAITNVVAELGKPIGNIKHSDFTNNGLAGLLVNYYHNHYRDALMEAGYKI